MFAILSLAAVGCQKENSTDSTRGTMVAEIGTMYKMQYVIDGVSHHIVLHGDRERSDFIYRMLALAEEGHSVSFFDESRVAQYGSRKETVYFSTTDKTEAFNWLDKMEDEGYTVSVTYNPDTHTYNCVAYR